MTAAVTCAASRSRPAVSGPSTAGHPPSSVRVTATHGSGPARAEAGGGSGGGGLPALPEDATALLLGGTAPDALRFAVRQREFQALLLYYARVADLLGPIDAVVFRRSVENLGVQPAARASKTPGQIHCGITFLSRLRSKPDSTEPVETPEMNYPTKVLPKSNFLGFRAPVGCGRGPRARPEVTFDRSVALERLASEPFDVLVVGGGITGAGVALDAASRGLRTALVERGDFGTGTSSRSSKLVHGGLRYLSQGDYRLVSQALAERQRLLRNAPHLVRPLPFLVPSYGSRTKMRAVSSALWLYDLTGGFRIGRLHRRLSTADALAAHAGPADRPAGGRPPVPRRPGRRRPPDPGRRPDGRARPPGRGRQPRRRHRAAAQAAPRSTSTVAASRSGPRPSSTPQASGPTPWRATGPPRSARPRACT